MRFVEQLLENIPLVAYHRGIKSPFLYTIHRFELLKCARRFLIKGDYYEAKVFFSDEKMFCLESPDRLHSYWHDLCKPPNLLFKRQNGVVVWFFGPLLASTGSLRCFFNGRQHSKRFFEVIFNGVVPFSSEMFGKDQSWVYHQHNSPIQKSVYKRTWISENSILCLKCPARSLNCNIIKNLLVIFARWVYIYWRKCQTLDDLEDAVVTVWDAIFTDEIFRLYRSIHGRFLFFIYWKRGIG